MTSPTKAEDSGSAAVLDPELTATTDVVKGEKQPEGRSPGQLMWQRFKRDRTGVVSACVVIFFFLVAALAPVISKLYGKDPYTLYAQEPDYPFLLDDFAMPSGDFGGISGDFWFGVEPKLGRDVFSMLLYGMRTSLYMAVLVTLLSVVTGVIIGLIGGYFGGRVDYWIGRVTDFFLGFPQQLFFIAFMPVVTAMFVDPQDETPTYLRAVAIIMVMWFLGWMGLARLVRSSVLSLRDREFVEAAKVSGAPPGRIVRKEILPNIVTPILVQATYILPSTILTIAFLSFIGVGFVEPTPDWGRMFKVGTDVYEQDPMFLLFPGAALVIFVLAFNLLGDSVRDAFDPKTGR
ncbi:ABC transporter permease [Streptomyces cellulosae]|jgi:peptide/nickel transport system permease protein|uniref:ABC transporter permease n=2 Tax=Streptomyces TaxID=1883 RepID=A0ABU3J3N4_9ACTN|nr:ABC transporter permease [Streptomyces sp. McG7]MDT6969157.1 ABC transporter permease [Streptomyces thermocarboxydus]MDX3416837.1 ABC transporter permease [Streptomyces sp. MD20-1-1]WSB86455.1 ABC transporter permease [Streptomyces cellulosae]WSB93139.1 ABC transporter permease [Streptomyces cellulosae]